MALDGETCPVPGVRQDAKGGDEGNNFVDILDAVDLPIIAVGRNCRIKRFNRAAAAVLHLNSSALGRSPGDVLADAPDLDRLCARVIADGAQGRRDIRFGDRSFLLRIAPYRVNDRQILGAVITFTNVTAFRASIDQAIYEREYTKAILNTVIDPLVVLDVSLRIQTANRAFYEMFGCSRDETQNVPLDHLGTGDWQACDLWQSLRIAISEDSEFQATEVECDFPPLGRKTLLADMRRLSRDGTTLLLMAFKDVTEYKRAQEAVRQRTAQFETLLNQAPLGVYLVDADFRIREMNPIALSVFGDIPGGVAGRDFDEIIHILWEKRYADELVAIYRNTLETGESYIAPERTEYRADRGVAEDYEWRLDRILLPDGRFGVVCYFRDISERRSAELTANLLASIVESSDDAIVSKDLDGVIMSWNRGAERLFGYSAAEAIGQSIALIIPPDRIEEEPRILERLKRGERVEHFETIRVGKNGARLNISLTVSPIRDSTGRIIGASKVARDISDRVRQDEALRAANSALNRANADLQQFAFSASHDLQEPLRTVAIFSELLQKTFGDKVGPAGAEHIEHVVGGVRRMERLLRDLRIYTQISTTGREPASLTDAGEAVKKAMLNLESAIAESGASIIGGDLPCVYMHGFQLEEIFQNLIGNAIRYRSELTPCIEIAAERQGDEWQFSVSDNGIGIEPEFHDRIFGLFTRLHSGPQYQGSGMGLAICRQIMERAGGRLWAESQPGKGSTFYFAVPVKSGTPAHEPSADLPGAVTSAV